MQGSAIVKIKMDDLVRAFRCSDVMQGYVDLRQGKVVLLDHEFNGEAFSGETDSEEEVLDHIFSIEEDWENYVPIPNVYDGHAREFMKAFAESLEAGSLREEVAAALQGTGVAGKFRRQLRKHSLAEEWEAFQQAEFRLLAEEWCRENEIEYE